MTANNEFTVSQGNENWEPILKMMIGWFGENKNLFSPNGISNKTV